MEVLIAALVLSLLIVTVIRSVLRRRRRPRTIYYPQAPGSTGYAQTIEVEPRRLRVRLEYSPSRDGRPDPGEIIWTWVPFQEGTGEGKDRPVLIVARESESAVLAVPLTSKPHVGEPGYVAIGRGNWDTSGRDSWVNLRRVFRVHNEGMRREAATLDGYRYELVAAELRRRYGW